MVVIASLRQVVELIRAESRSPRPDGSLLAMAVLYLARSAKSRECDDAINALAHLIDDHGWRPEVPDYAVDLHTAAGRAKHSERDLLRFWLDEGAKLDGDVGDLDWRLWIRRWGVRQGVLDRGEVEGQAIEWDRQGRLRYGVDGYSPRPD